MLQSFPQELQDGLFSEGLLLGILVRVKLAIKITCKDWFL
jgi:hypothetical protein